MFTGSKIQMPNSKPEIKARDKDGLKSKWDKYCDLYRIANPEQDASKLLRQALREFMAKHPIKSNTAHGQDVDQSIKPKIRKN
jgi:hypothetical protein